MAERSGFESDWGRDWWPVYEVSSGADKDETDFGILVRDKSEEAVTLLLKKHADYGPNNIALSPFGPLEGLTVRLWDKVARLAHLLKEGKTPDNESVRDTLIDISNYGLIGVMVVDGCWNSEKETNA